MLDVVRCIKEFNAGRDPDRLRLKYQALRTEPFVFLRGTCHLVLNAHVLTRWMRESLRRS